MKELERRLAILLTAFFVAGAFFGFVVRTATADLFADNKIVRTEIYTVKKGDTFWNIAEEYRARDCRNPYILQYMEELRDANPNLRENHSQIRAGDELTITYYEAEQ